MAHFSFIILALLVMDACWWALVDRRLRMHKARWGWRIAVGVWAVVMMANVCVWLLPPVISAHLQSRLPEPFLAGVFVWHLLALPLGCVAMVFADTIVHAWQRFHARSIRRRPAPVSPPPADPPPDAEPLGASRLTRRELFGMAATSVAPVILTGGTAKAVFDLQDYNVRHRDLIVHGLPHEFEGLTIAHLSDLHHGRFTDQAFLDRVAQTVNLMKADLVLFTGDLIDRNLYDLPMAIDMAKSLQSNFGMAFCLGNHDLFDSRPGFITAMHKAHLPLLIDEKMDLAVRGKTLRLLGLDWERSADGIPAESREFLKSHDPSVFTIALAHHPHAFDLTAKAGIPITLSGHTHGGQLMATPTIGLGSIAFRYWSGLYRQNNASMIVSNGVGNWFPVRINAPAEIEKLTLRRPA